MCHWIGYIDSYGAVHATILFDDQDIMHETLFPNQPCYKRWRWWKCKGLDTSPLNQVNPNEEDLEQIRSWLFKHGCFNYWEID